MRPRRRHLIVVVLALLITVGCRVDTTATVTVDEDGSGTVSVELVLDREAVLRLGDVGSQLRVDDLVDAGWEVTGPEPTPDEGARVVVTKPFADPDQAAAVLSEVTGVDGPLRDATVEQQRRFGRVEQSFTATLDLSGGIEAFGDEELTAVLNDLPIGQDVAALEEELGAPLADLTSFTVVAELPAGEVTASGDPEVTETETSRVFRWEGSLGDPARDLGAGTEETDWAVIGLGALAVVAALALAVLIVVRLVGRRRRRKRADDA
jgi:hypothetical protein